MLLDRAGIAFERPLGDQDFADLPIPEQAGTTEAAAFAPLLSLRASRRNLVPIEHHAHPDCLVAFVSRNDGPPKKRQRVRLDLSGRSDAGRDRGVALRSRAGLGVRLRLLDVEPGDRVRRGAAGLSPRLPPQLLPLFARLSRHAAASGAGARARPRRVVPRHRLSPAPRPGRRDARPDLGPRDDRAGLSDAPGRSADAAGRCSGACLHRTPRIRRIMPAA